MPTNSFFILKGGLHDAERKKTDNPRLHDAKKRKKENRQPKGGMGGRHDASSLLARAKFFPNRPSTRAEAPAPGV